MPDDGRPATVRFTGGLRNADPQSKCDTFKEAESGNAAGFLIWQNRVEEMYGYHQLARAERYLIAGMRKQRSPVPLIAHRLGRHGAACSPSAHPRAVRDEAIASGLDHPPRTRHDTRTPAEPFRRIPVAAPAGCV